MAEWKEYKLGDLVQYITSGGTPKSSEALYYDGDIPWLNTKEINFNRIYKTERFITEAGLQNSSAKWIPKNSVIVAMYGATAGRVAYSLIDLTTNQACCNIIVNDKLADSLYVYYYLESSYTELVNLACGAAQQNLSVNVIYNFPILLPPLSEQKRIASILRSLDDKIDLLQRENKTLEAMAETLFRKWFIEEVRHEVSLGDVVETTSGGTPSRKCEEYYQNGIIDWVKSKELNRSFLLKTEEKITVEAVENSSAKFLPANSVLIAMYGATVGEYAIIAKEMTCNQAVCALKPNDNYPYTYLYLWAKFMQDEFLNLACGAAQQNISQVLIKQQQICSDVDVVKQFHYIVEPFFEKIKQNEMQLSSLEEMKNLILPKLMNNE